MRKLGRRAFGTAWREIDPDWNALQAIGAWEEECRSRNLPRNFRQVMAGLDDLEPIVELLKQIARDFKPMIEELRKLFDLLLIDEAGQVRPVEELGAIARTHQAVVVGDERLLRLRLLMPRPRITGGGTWDRTGTFAALSI